MLPTTIECNNIYHNDIYIKISDHVHDHVDENAYYHTFDKYLKKCIDNCTHENELERITNNFVIDDIARIITRYNSINRLHYEIIEQWDAAYREYNIDHTVRFTEIHRVISIVKNGKNII